MPLVKNKSGDITDKNNYRPIALSTMSSKIFERILLERYDECFDTVDNQFGFKKDHATDLCVYSFKEILHIYNDYSSPLYICFLDASKAFDKLNYWLLFDKLIQRNLPLPIVRILVMWYTCQQLNVQWGSNFSSHFTVSNGVRQGGILSPKFFNLYMDKLSHILNASRTGCNYNGAFINHLSYADDMCLIAPSARALQVLLDHCHRYAESHNIIYNGTKSVCMYVKSKKFKVSNIPKVKLGSNVLEYVPSYKYLGCMISDTLSDDTDIRKTLRGIYARSNMLIRKFYHCNDLVKQTLFQTYCTNFYCTQLWWCYTEKSINKVRVAFNNSCRYFLGYTRSCSASGMFIENGLDGFNVLRRKYIYKFICRLKSSQNQILSSLYMSYCQSHSMNEWTKCLYLF